MGRHHLLSSPSCYCTFSESSSRRSESCPTGNLTQAPLQCERRSLLTHFHPLQRAMTVRHGVLLGQVSTQPLRIARQDRFCKSFATATIIISKLLEEISVLLRHVSPVGQPQGGRLPVGSSGRLGKWPLRVARSCDLAAAGNTI